jgi:hypothetical protein
MRSLILPLIKKALARVGWDGYEPAHHYMRGPGPKARERAAAAQDDKSDPKSQDGERDPAVLEAMDRSRGSGRR